MFNHFYVFLDHKIHQTGYEEFGFSVISHVENEVIQKKIPCFCNKNEENILLQLKTGQLSISKNKLPVKSEKYFEQQLKGIIDKDVYSIPYVDEQSIHPNLEGPFLIIMKTLKKWCYVNNQNEAEMKGLVICDYSLDSHLEFLNFPNSIFKKVDFGLNSEKFLKESNKLIIAYNPAKKVIFLIRSANIKNLEGIMQVSINDVMKFVLLHFDVLKNSGVKVINLLVTEKEIIDFPLVCESCKHHVISMDTMKSVDHFQNWLKRKNQKFSVSHDYENINENFSKEFCAQLLFFLATHRIQTESFFSRMLPLKTDNLRDQVEEANFLTYEHLRIIYAETKQQMVFGWCYSGILAVAQKRAELISTKLKCDEILCFICCDSKSQLLTDKESTTKMELFWDGNLCDTIKKILENNKTKQKIHLVAVEYDLEELSNIQLTELNEMLTENKQLKDSYIFLACQPIQKERILEVRGEEYITITKTESNLYHKLSMKKEKLHYNKTNTLEINTLIAFTADDLKDEPTVLQLSYNDIKGENNPFKPEPKSETENHDHSFLEPILEKGEKEITFDEIFELCSMNDAVFSNSQASHAVTVQTNFQYIIKPSKSEVNKELVKPSIVEIKYTKHSKEFMILNLKNTLDQIIHHKYRDQKDYDLLKSCNQEKYVILHFDIENDFPQYFRIVFRLMGKEQGVTDKYKEFVENEDKTILICNYRSFRGLTSSNVIVVLEPSLYHRKFYVLESLSTASISLDIIVLHIAHSEKSKNYKKTFQSTINNWKNSDNKNSLFSPLKLVDCEKQNGNERNATKEKSLSRDLAKIRKWFAEPKSHASCIKTDLTPNLAR